MTEIVTRRTLSPQNPDESTHRGRPSRLIDLHLHSTASDGVDAPEALMANCAAAGLAVVAVTDHDTIEAIPAAEAAARRAGLGFVTGIEITAVWRRKDVHVLGYFFDPLAPALAAFLVDQCRDRIRRARVMGVRLASMGVPIDIEQVIASAGDRPVSRPAIAQALVDAGHVDRRQDAFEQYVGEGAPAFAPRAGVTVRRAIRIVKDAGGIVSLAHPGVAGIDGVIADFAGAGLDALEVYHADHADADRRRYLALARRLNLGVTGGSDYHGDQSHHPGGLGSFVVPPGDFDDLCRRAGLRGITL